ncbi:MAG TPA: excinuclease ABC subunit UvrC [Kiritimatiellia bacterium]|nr:excinuclease ABC subunit UvrC [Kiritimatiellia bacterium]HMO98882.1 excinuclease ABC subunit UvrC [Kiritimatiellia bacterium]HMP97626.1 excinuclease ABC subunit UvrC [Kiritimatiellia bacterium]
MNLTDKIKERLRSLPDKPGVYVMRDKNGRIIYVGKASSLRGRVRHYFQQATLRGADPKLRGLINSIADFEFIVVRSDAEAIVTEGRMIKEYRPRYNAYFKDDKRFLLLRVDREAPLPKFEVCRIKKQDGAEYLGPYARAGAARAALTYVEKKYGLRSCRPRLPDQEDYRHCHNDVIRFCSAPCIGRISREDYRVRVDEAIALLRGERREELQRLREQMEAASAALDYEQAALLRDTLDALWSAIKQRSRGEKDLDLKLDDARRGAEELQGILGLPGPATVIECFDNSNLGGTFPVSAMVCAINGAPRPQRYRHYRIRTVEGSDDPATMAEVVGRRYRRLLDEGQSLPDLVLIDGGITQLAAARDALAALGLSGLPTAGLAKKFEEIYVATDFSTPPIRLPADSNALKVLQRLRDEAHRFSISFHRSLRAKRIRDSALDEVEGIGAKRKELLMKHFGSVRRMARVSVEEIAAVPGIGPVLAASIKESLSAR